MERLQTPMRYDTVITWDGYIFCFGITPRENRLSGRRSAWTDCLHRSAGTTDVLKRLSRSCLTFRQGKRVNGRSPSRAGRWQSIAGRETVIVTTKDIVALLESITESDTETAIDYSVDIASWLKNNRTSIQLNMDGELTLMLSALYKLGKRDAGRPSDPKDDRPIFHSPFPT